MRFKRTVIALVTGALVLAPAAGAAAEETYVDPQIIVTPESQDSAQQSTETVEAPEAPETAAPEAAQASAEKAAPQRAAAAQAAPAKLASAQSAVKVTSRVVGSPKVGSKLRVKATATSPVKLNRGYTWYAGGKKVGSGASYRVKAKDVGKRISVATVVSWKAGTTYAAGKKQVSSAKTVKVVKARAAVKVAKVKISGTAKAGKKLTAKATVKKPRDLKVSGAYTWYVGGKKVKTGKTLRLKPSYVKKSVKVVYKAKWKSSKYVAGSKKKSSSSKKVRFDTSAKAIAATARKATGIPYAWGASSRSGADCSGLVKYVYGQHGVPLPGNDAAIAAKGKPVSNPRPGDVVHWRSGHVGIYLGKGKMVHASQPGTKSSIVNIADMRMPTGHSYYRMV